MKNIFETLSNMRMFRQVDELDLKELIYRSIIRKYDTGNVIFKQGRPASCAMVLVEGELDVFLNEKEKSRQIGRIFPGEIFGEQGLFHHREVRNATVIAAKNSVCLRLNPELMRENWNNTAIVALETHLISAMARRIRKSNTNMQVSWREESQTKRNEKEQFLHILSRLEKGYGART